MTERPDNRDEEPRDEAETEPLPAEPSTEPPSSEPASSDEPTSDEPATPRSSGLLESEWSNVVEPTKRRTDDPTEEKPAAESSSARSSSLLDSEWSNVGATPTDPPPATAVAPEPARSDLAVDTTSLIGGLCLIALGTLLVLETEDVINLTLGYVWPALLAAAGATLLASGLRKGRR